MIKKLFSLALLAFALVSCGGDAYMENYETVCENARKRIVSAESPKEVREMLHEFVSELKELEKEYPEDTQKYARANTQDKEQYAMYRRRIKAYNSVTGLGAKKFQEFAKAKKEGK